VITAWPVEAMDQMKWSETPITFKPKDHPTTELSNRNLCFVVKILISKHKVVKTLIDNGSALNLIMRYIYLEMKLPMASL
jgi:hypothetical protein